jgi:hypothetical protein
LSIANNLAIAYIKQQNRLEKAEAIMQRTIAGYRLLYGKDSDSRIIYKSNFAEI